MKKLIAVLIGTALPLIASADMSGYKNIRVLMDGSQEDGLPPQVQGHSQGKALAVLIDHRFKIATASVDESITQDELRAREARVRYEVYEEIKEGTLQYKSGFAHGWHMIVGTPVSFFRVILFAPIALIFGIATGIASTDGWL